MDIRHFRPEDTEAIQKLVGVLQEHVAELDPFGRLRRLKDFDPVRHFSTVTEDNEKREGTIIVADEHGTIIGVAIGAVIQQDEEYQMAHYTDKFGQIFEICVDERYRKQNIGQQLLTAMEGYLRTIGCAYVQLDCLDTNEPAQKFYLKNGFKKRNIQMMKKL